MEVINVTARAEKAQGIKILELECIQQNTPALKLYQRAGFETMRELLGWERDVPQPQEFSPDDAIEECSIAEVDELVKKYGAKDLSWQAWGFSRLPHADRGFKLGHAYCVVSDPDDEKSDTIKLWSLIVEPQHRGNGEAKRLAKAMMGKYTGKKWGVNPIFAKEYGDKLAQELGFSETKLTEYQMRLDISSKDFE